MAWLEFSFGRSGRCPTPDCAPITSAPCVLLYADVSVLHRSVPFLHQLIAEFGCGDDTPAPESAFCTHVHVMRWMRPRWPWPGLPLTPVPAKPCSFNYNDDGAASVLSMLSSQLERVSTFLRKPLLVLKLTRRCPVYFSEKTLLLGPGEMEPRVCFIRAPLLTADFCSNADPAERALISNFSIISYV